MTIRVHINVPGVNARFGERFAAAQKYLDSEVLRCSAPYVPMRTGALMRSGTNGTKIGSGMIIYNAPYVKAMYYGRTYRFSKDKHPQACAQWFEKAKAAHEGAWIKGVSDIIRG